MNLKLEHPETGKYKVFAGYDEACEVQDKLKDEEKVRYYIFYTNDAVTEDWVVPVQMKPKEEKTPEKTTKKRKKPLVKKK
jgi:hypothetical protein